jgi:hypothetical protein
MGDRTSRPRHTARGGHSRCPFSHCLVVGGELTEFRRRERLTALGGLALAGFLLFATGSGVTVSALICAGENRPHYPATCSLIENHSGLVSGLVLGPTLVIVLMTIVGASTRAALIVGGLSAAFWGGYFISLVLT